MDAANVTGSAEIATGQVAVTRGCGTFASLHSAAAQARLVAVTIARLKPPPPRGSPPLLPPKGPVLVEIIGVSGDPGRTTGRQSMPTHHQRQARRTERIKASDGDAACPSGSTFTGTGKLQVMLMAHMDGRDHPGRYPHDATLPRDGNKLWPRHRRMSKGSVAVIPFRLRYCR